MAKKKKAPSAKSGNVEEEEWLSSLSPSERASIPSGETFITARPSKPGERAVEATSDHTGKAVDAEPPRRHDDLYVPSGYIETEWSGTISKRWVIRGSDWPAATQEDHDSLRSLVEGLAHLLRSNAASRPDVKKVVHDAYVTLWGHPPGSRWRTDLERALEIVWVNRKNRDRVNTLDQKPRDPRGWKVLEEQADAWNATLGPGQEWMRQTAEDYVETASFGNGEPMTPAGLLEHMKRFHDDLPSELTKDVIEAMLDQLGGGGGRGRGNAKRTAKKIVADFCDQIGADSKSSKAKNNKRGN